MAGRVNLLPEPRTTVLFTGEMAAGLEGGLAASRSLAERDITCQNQHDPNNAWEPKKKKKKDRR